MQQRAQQGDGAGTSIAGGLLPLQGSSGSKANTHTRHEEFWHVGSMLHRGGQAAPSLGAGVTRGRPIRFEVQKLVHQPFCCSMARLSVLVTTTRVLSQSILPHMVNGRHG
jgi:hypothetical protein